MSVLERVLALFPPAEVLRSPTSPGPLASRLGAPAVRVPEGAVPRADPPPDTWAAADRGDHRHGWFASGFLARAHGDAEAGRRAIAALEGWLRFDRPGTGTGWEHPSDLAARLVHWHAGLAWGGAAIPTSLRDALAGSADWHLRHLQSRLPTGAGDGLRRIAHYSGLVVGGLTFLDVPCSRALWSEGLAGLRRQLPAEFRGDGSPRTNAPQQVAEALWYAVLARAISRANGAAFPSHADAAIARGSRYIERITGEIGRIPSIGEAPAARVLAADAPLAWSLWNIACAWGLAEGDPAPGAERDPRLDWLGLPAPAASADAAPRSWAMWSFREAGDAVAHMRIKGRPGRVIVQAGGSETGSPLAHAVPLQVLWDVGGAAVLADPGSDPGPNAALLRSLAAHGALIVDGGEPGVRVPATLDVARVDGRKARIEGRHLGWAGLEHRREVLLNQARLIVTDVIVPTGRRAGRHALRLRWQLGAGWAIEPDGAGWIARNDGLTLVIQLPAELSWTLAEGWADGPAPCFIGDGGMDREATFASSFEIR